MPSRWPQSHVCLRNAARQRSLKLRPNRLHWTSGMPLAELPAGRIPVLEVLRLAIVIASKFEKTTSKFSVE
jgi:hypothetical protein